MNEELESHSKMLDRQPWQTIASHYLRQLGLLKSHRMVSNGFQCYMQIDLNSNIQYKQTTWADQTKGEDNIRKESSGYLTRKGRPLKKLITVYCTLNHSPRQSKNSEKSEEEENHSAIMLQPPQLQLLRRASHAILHKQPRNH